MSTAPLGWENNWVSQAQIYPGYGGDSDNGLNKTVQAFSGALVNPLQRPVPGDRDALSGYMTYFGDGTVTVNRHGLIAPKDLVDNNKMSWKISQDMGQRFHPLMTVYMNDASTSESAFNLLTDLSSAGGTTNKKSIPVNILANIALQVGALLGARTWAANQDAGIPNPSSTPLDKTQIAQLDRLKNGDGVFGDVLVTPDGFGSFIQNYQLNTASGHINAGTSMQYSLASYEQMLVPTNDGSGWKLVPKNGGPEQMLPGNGEALSEDAVVIGFDDHHDGIEPDRDFDDVLIRMISGGEWIL